MCPNYYKTLLTTSDPTKEIWELFYYLYDYFISLSLDSTDGSICKVLAHKQRTCFSPQKTEKAGCKWQAPVNPVMGRQRQDDPRSLLSSQSTQISESLAQ